MSTSRIPATAAPSAPASQTKARAYLPGLDGVRAIAVVAVCLFHFVVPHTQGGFLGVDVFFIVSGYLITSQLWTRWGDSKIHLWHFWEGRIRRLFPAVWATCLVTAIAMLAMGRDQMRGFLGDLAAAATYTSNWWYIHKGSAYAVEWGLQRPPVLQHLWSLAVEEQFYLIWPLVIAAGIIAFRRSKATRTGLMIIAGLLAVASMATMTLGSMGANLPRMGDYGMLSADRFYYGTDSHSMGLLLGAVLALWRGGRGFGEMASGHKLAPLQKATPIWTVLGFASLAGLFAAFALVEYNQVWLYRYGFHLVALASLLVVAVATRPGPLGSLLSLAPLRWIGQRSYSIYLWHWPIVCFTRPVDLGLTEGTDSARWTSLIIRVVLTLIFAELSYRFIETPIRRYGWAAAWNWLGKRHLRTALAALITLTLGLSGAWAANHPDKTITDVLQQEINDDDFDPDVTVEPTPSAAPSSAATPGATAKPSASPSPPPRAASTKNMTVTYYGDSFAVGAAPGLKKVFKSVELHAAVARQSEAVFKEMRQNVGKRFDVVILHTGNNGTVTESSLRAILKAYAKAPRVIVVLPHTPRSWTADARELITKVCGTPDKPLLDNVRVADWYGIASGHEDEFLVHDRVHPNRAGIKAYTKLIQETAVRG